MLDTPFRTRIGSAIAIAVLCAAQSAPAPVVGVRIEDVAAWIEDARFDAALEEIERALASSAGDDVGAWLQLRGRALRLAQRADDPAALAAASRAVDVAVAGGDVARIASAQFDLGALLVQLGERERERAAAALDAAISAAGRCTPPDDALRADALIYRAELTKSGPEKDALLAQAAAIHARVLDPLDPRCTFRVTRESKRAFDEGDEERAFELARAAVGAYRARLRPDHPRLAMALHNLGTYAKELGDLPAAIAALEEAYGIRRSERSRRACLTLMLLAQVRDEVGDADTALALHEQALAEIESVGGRNHTDLVVPLRALTRHAFRRGDLDAAEAHARRALGILGESDAAAEDRANAQNDLAVVEWRRGNLDEAERMWREALAELEERGGTASSAAVGLLLQLGAAAGGSGRPDAKTESLALFERAVATERALVDPNHRNLSWTLKMLAEAQAAAGDGDRAFESSLEAAAIVRRNLEDAAARLAERDALGYTAEMTPGLPLAVHLASLAPATRGVRAWDALIAARAGVFEAVRARRAGLRGPAEPIVARRAPTVAELASARPPGVAVVAYLRTERPDAYFAFVMPPGKSGPRVLDLGPATEIDDMVAPLRALARTDGSEAVWRAKAAPLRERVWDPFAKDLEGAAEIHVVLDGALLFLDLCALPFGESEYLLERAAPIHVLNAERDLVAAARVAPRRESAGILAIGGPDFGAPAASDEVPTRGPAAAPTMRFPHLEKLEVEAGAVAELWRRDGRAAKTLVGAAATEAAVRESVAGVRVLHVATHGFARGSSSGAGQRGLADEPDGPAPQAPLRLGLSRQHLGGSGLALAGANVGARAPGADDGILSDADVVALDLDGLELAILSACDSGTGEVQSGEGVFGLRRAFQLAGARAVVASLWPVGDEDTLALMTDLHARLLAGDTTVARALHDAKRAALARRRASGAGAHPWHWAGFVVAGEPVRSP